MVKFDKKIVENYNFVADKNGRKYYKIGDVVEMAQLLSKDMKFIPSLEIYVTLGIDPRHADQNLRFMANITHGTGQKSQRIAVISINQEDIDKARELGAHVAGGMDVIESIKKGNIDFDLTITTPQSMGLLSQVAMILGKKGLMPNPKLGRVTTDIAQAVRNAKNQVEIRADKTGIIRRGIGKMSFKKDELVQNVRDLVKDIIAHKPSGAKGKYLREVFLSFTMGPAFRINLADFEV